MVGIKTKLQADPVADRKPFYSPCAFGIWVFGICDRFVTLPVFTGFRAPEAFAPPPWPLAVTPAVDPAMVIDGERRSCKMRDGK
jgi:hypothetical protein